MRGPAVEPATELATESATLAATAAATASKTEARRAARSLETRLLAGLILYGEAFEKLEDLGEELALHYSVDVSMPDHFTEWLFRLAHKGGSGSGSGKRAKELIEILGLAESSEEGSEAEQRGLGTRSAPSRPLERRSSIVWPRTPEEQLLSPLERKRTAGDPPATAEPQGTETLEKRRRISHRPGSHGTFGDRRFQIELMESPVSPLAAGRIESVAKRRPTTAVLATTPKKQVPLDRTVILETPPRPAGPQSSSPTKSRSSTPGCSQAISSLCLDDTRGAGVE